MKLNLSLLIFLIILSIILFIRFISFYSNVQDFKDGQILDFKLKLLSQPQIFGSYQRISANLPKGERIFITTSLNPRLNYSDRVRVLGKIKVLSKDKDVLSSKRNKLLIQGPVSLAMYFPKITIMENNQVSLGFFLEKPLSLVSSIRQKLISLFLHTLPSPTGSLLLGIVFGIKESMPKDFNENLRVSGVLHVIAASGMNVTLLGGFIYSFFAFFLKRQIALVLGIFGIIFYAFLAGLEPSIIRASIMGIMVFSSQILGRQTLAGYGLFITGFLMLFMDPALIFDIGFQLSFLATLGILYIKPVLDQKFKPKNFVGKSITGSEITTTVSAQLITLPIILANFGSYSLWSILVNGLILWTIPILMIIGGIGAIASLIFVPLGSFILYFSYPLLLYFQKIVEFFGHLGGNLSIEAFPWTLIIGYYSLMASIVIFLRRRNIR